MRRYVVMAAGLAAVLALGVFLGAAIAGRSSQRLDGPVGRQAILIRTAPITTQSNSFEDIPGLSHEVIKNRGAYTITFSGEITGGPVEVRIPGARPGPVVFATGGAPGGSEQRSSYSFTFADRAAAEGTCSTIAAEWRSVDGTPVTLEAATVVVTYRYVGDKRAREIGCV